MTDKSSEEGVSFTLLGNMLVLATDMNIYARKRKKGRWIKLANRDTRVLCTSL